MVLGGVGENGGVIEVGDVTRHVEGALLAPHMDLQRIKGVRGNKCTV